MVIKYRQLFKASLGEVIKEAKEIEEEEDNKIPEETHKHLEDMEPSEPHVKEGKSKLEKHQLPPKKILDSNALRKMKKVQNPDMVTIGMVGYPNVGKSSVVNVLCGKKLVGVAARPGKTRNFQTIFLEENLVLCDCPGLVFPSIVSSKAEMVCNGVYPIDNLREFIEPVKFLTDKIPRKVFEYVLKCSTSSTDYKIDSSRLLHSYAVSRGYMMQGSGLPDYRKASRIILKAAVNGELIYARLPEGELESKDQFNIVPDDYTPHVPLINEKDNKGR